MTRINIVLTLNEETYYLSVDKENPVTEQVKRYLSLVSESKHPRLALTHNTSLVDPSLTATDLKLKSGDLLEGYDSVPRKDASPTLLSHLSREGFDASKFTFIAPDIAGYTLR